MRTALHAVAQGVKEIPFHGRTVQMETGNLLTASGEAAFRYSFSLALVRARYRITLQFSGDEQHTPYVFDIIRPAPGEPIDVRPESEDSRSVWSDPRSPRYAQLLEAAHALYAQRIEPTVTP